MRGRVSIKIPKCESWGRNTDQPGGARPGAEAGLVGVVTCRLSWGRAQPHPRGLRMGPDWSTMGFRPKGVPNGSWQEVREGKIGTHFNLYQGGSIWWRTAEGL